MTRASGYPNRVRVCNIRSYVYLLILKNILYIYKCEYSLKTIDIYIHLNERTPTIYLLNEVFGPWEP